MNADPIAEVTIRKLGRPDHDAVRKLAQLDTRRVPDGELLGVEVEGRLLAVYPLDGGELIADPFSRTDEVRALLEVRGRQLMRRERHRGGSFGRFRRRPAEVGLTAPAPGAVAGVLAAPPGRS